LLTSLPSHSLEYLVQNASRFWASGFAPTDSDILESRATTMGISESTFAVKDMVRQDQTLPIALVQG
jgi:hypothetical protein